MQSFANPLLTPLGRFQTVHDGFGGCEYEELGLRFAGGLELSGAPCPTSGCLLRTGGTSALMTSRDQALSASSTRQVRVPRAHFLQGTSAKVL